MAAGLVAAATVAGPLLSETVLGLVDRIATGEVATVTSGPSTGDPSTGDPSTGVSGEPGSESTTGTPVTGTNPGTPGGAVPGAPGIGGALSDVIDIVDRGDDDNVTEGEIEDIYDILKGLTTEELDWVLANMSDEQLERMFGGVHRDGFLPWDGWSEDEIADFYDNLMRVGTDGNFETWARLAEFAPNINTPNPDPTLGLPDSARADSEDEAWWEGLDYEPITEPLFNPTTGEPSFTDPRQGSIGDCYLIAALIDLAKEDPAIIKGMITENPNGTVTITFGDGHQEIVERTQVIDELGRPAFATDASGGSWPTLIEKAYAQRYDGWGSDPGITGGAVSTAIERLTGRESSWVPSDDLSLSDLAERFTNGDNLAIATQDRPDDMTNDEWLADPDTPEAFKLGLDEDTPDSYDRLHQNHAFVITNVDEANGTVSVLNPWNPSKPDLQLTYEQLQDAIAGVYVNEAD